MNHLEHLKNRIMADNSFRDRLRRAGLIGPAKASLSPLTGEVFSDIYLVKVGKRKWGVKRVSQKLKIRDDWYADTSKNPLH